MAQLEVELSNPLVDSTTPANALTSEPKYERFTAPRKALITAVLSFTAFLAPISTTSILAATDEVVDTFDTTLTVVNISNAVYLGFMGLCPCFWGPLGEIFGRRCV